ncbi:MAG: winged helix-turn-helix transcriptional regulator [Ruminococcus sp.]|nr:winged helix-turn-helix transcriptional regulator [Ruminococcus sp.]
MSINKILSALADDTRRAIIMKLREGKISTGELAEHLGITPQALSYHLSKLKKAEIIYETKYKNFIYYELNLSVLGELIVWLDSLKGDKNDEN